MSKLKEFFKSSWLGVIMVVVVMAIGITCLWSVINYSKKPQSQNIETFNYSVQIYHDNMDLMYECARGELVKSIDFIIRETAPNTCVNGLAILRGCEKYDVDLFFVLAQGQLESHFGTKGLAAKTNSIFNVFAYDGHDYDTINKKGKYSHPDYSIEPYLHLLTNDYMVNGKTEQDLMIEFISTNGNRYASSESYETNLTNIYNTYINNERLTRAYQEYKKYKILSGN